MTDRPILFSGPMVRALLDGRKSQTRRVLKPQPDTGGIVPRPVVFDGHAFFNWREQGCELEDVEKLPVWIGDRLWVREAFRLDEGHERGKPSDLGGAWVFFEADENDQAMGGLRESGLGEYGRLRPSIHMPRWASRLTLTVTDVRVQRVQEISAQDARDEGVDQRSRKVRQFNLLGADQDERDRQYLNACKWEFEDLWNTLNADRGFGWDTNPWVCAITFETEQRNIDA